MTYIIPYKYVKITQMAGKTVMSTTEPIKEVREPFSMWLYEMQLLAYGNVFLYETDENDNAVQPNKINESNNLNDKTD